MQESKTESKTKKFIKTYSKIIVMLLLIVGAWVAGKMNWNPENIDRNCKIVQLGTQTTVMTALLSEDVYKKYDITKEDAIKIVTDLVTAFDSAITQLESNKVNTTEVRTVVCSEVKPLTGKNPSISALTDAVITSIFISIDNAASDQKLDNAAYIKLLKSIKLGLQNAINSVSDIPESK